MAYMWEGCMMPLSYWSIPLLIFESSFPNKPSWWVMPSLPLWRTSRRWAHPVSRHDPPMVGCLYLWGPCRVPFRWTSKIIWCKWVWGSLFLMICRVYICDILNVIILIPLIISWQDLVQSRKYKLISKVRSWKDSTDNNLDALLVHQRRI